MQAIDSETYLIRPGCLAPKLVCMTWAWGRPARSSIGLRNTFHEDLKTLLSMEKAVFHNSAFDLAVFAANGFPIETIFDWLSNDRIADTMLREKLLDIAEGVYRGYVVVNGQTVKRTYSLAALARKYLGVELDKGDGTWRLRYCELDGVPLDRWPAAAREYAELDARTTLEVWYGQAERRTRLAEKLGDDPLVDEFRQVRRLFALHLMAAHGIRTDPEKTADLEDETQEAFDELKSALCDVGLVREDGSRNTKAAKEWMVRVCEEEGLEVPLTDKGNVALNKDACTQTGDEALALYCDITSYRTVLSKDVAALKKGLIQTRINSILETGRPSSSAPNIFNVRAMPGIRECFVPRKGCWFLQADYSGLELATLAQVCLEIVGYSRLAETINRYGSAGMAHTLFARDALGVPEDSPDFYNARQTAKVANFGFSGMLGITRLIFFARAKYGVLLDEDQARALKANWFNQWPEMREYFRLISDACEATGTTTIRQLYSGRYRGGARAPVAANSNFQGLGADATGLALYEIQRQCYADPTSPLFGARTVNYLYDEFILEVPADVDIANAMAERLVEVGETEANRFLPDVPVKMDTPALMECWSKEAKPTYDEEGRLIPWTCTNIFGRR